MRDPDLVQRAERAAIALERAWGHWRVMHGLGTDPLPPVSSYVGYSLDEPWGQPRVVFGVGAEEAEKLAALLDGHDCVGPVHAEVSGRPDWWRTTDSQAAAPALPHEDHVAVPAQAVAAATHDEASWPAPHADQSEPDDISRGASQSGERWPADGPACEDPEEPDRDTQVQAAITGGEEQARPSVPDLAISRRFPAAPLLPAAARGPRRPAPAASVTSEDAGADAFDPEITQISALGQPGIVAFRRRGEDEAGPQELAPLPAMPADSAAFEMPSQGPGYRGPRYQGFPPQYQPGLDSDTEPGSTAASAERDAEPSGPELDRATPLLVSRLGRSRRSTGGAHEAGTWAQQPEHGQNATDTAV